MMRNPALFLAALLIPVASAVAQDSADPQLLGAIQKIKAIDNHSHAMPASKPERAELERPDPLGKTLFPYPVRLRLDNPEYREAWRALYGYRHEDMTADHAREALAAKLRLMETKGDAYPSWVLDQANIDVMLVNMPSLGAGQAAPRFLWVPSADGLLYPFASEHEGIQSMRTEIGLGPPPATLVAYLDGVAKARLQRWQTAGAVAIKFAIAYIRPLDFADVASADAKSIYERRTGGAELSAADTKALADFLFRALAGEAGRLGMAVHIHTGIGADPHFNLAGANPLLLEPAFNDPSLAAINFVMVHGGWPFDRQAGAMLLRPNVYADFSAQTFLRSTEELSATLQAWLEFSPEKVLFGTDAYSEDTPLANWEEKAWLTSRTSRQALALALTRMLQAGQITRPRAKDLAWMVLRDNAAKLYGLGNPWDAGRR